MQPRLTFKGLLFATVYSLLLIFLLGLYGLSIWQKRLYLNDQLLAVGQDAALSLGLSLSTLKHDDNWVAASSMVDAIFDSGNYLTISIDSPTGAPILQRRAPLRLEGVPAWFVKALPLHVPIAEASIMAGWRQMGSLKLAAHPGFAYRDLWQTLKWHGVYFALLALVTFVLLRSLLALLVRPLSQLEQAAQQIQRRDFDVDLPMPSTQELRSVTSAMNSMARSIRRTFEEQLKTVEALRRRLFTDPLTLLMNRQAFEKRLAISLQDEHHAMGVLMLVDIADLGGLNDLVGRGKADTCLKSLAEMLTDLAEEIPGSLVGRLSAHSFALYFPTADYPAVEALNQRLQARLKPQNDRALPKTHLPTIGLVKSGHRATTSQVFSAADFAIQQARTERRWWGWYQSDGDFPGNEVRSAEAWQKFLHSAIASGYFTLYFQPVRAAAAESNLLQQVLVRIRDDERVLSAAEFLPMVRRFALSLAFDMKILQKVLGRLQEDASCVSMSVQLAGDSLGAMELVPALTELLTGCAEQCDRLYLTCPWWAVAGHRTSFDRLLQLRQVFGFKLALNRFGAEERSLGLLQDIDIDLVYLDPSLAAALDVEDERKLYVRSIIQMAHGQDVRVIATGVENRSEWEALNEIGVDAISGFYIAHPQESPAR